MNGGSAKLLNVPLELIWRGDIPLVGLGEIEPDILDTIFWDEAAAKARRTALVPLDSLPLTSDGPPLCGAIHHLTRCGSTALLRQFDAIDGIFGLSEPFIFLQLLDRAEETELTRNRVCKLLAAFQTALAPIAQRLVVKWPTLLCRHAAFLEDALPNVPAIFLYRDPLEILASIEARPLGDMDGMPQSLLTGPDGAETQQMGSSNSLADATAALAANCRWVTRSSSIPRLNYVDLPDAGWTHVAPHFGITPSVQDQNAMAAAATMDAKQPMQKFFGDSAQKRQRLSPESRALAETILMPALVEMEASLPVLLPR